MLLCKSTAVIIIFRRRTFCSVGVYDTTLQGTSLRLNVYILVIGALQVQNYALFVSHKHPDGHVSSWYQFLTPFFVSNSNSPSLFYISLGSFQCIFDSKEGTSMGNVHDWYQYPYWVWRSLLWRAHSWGKWQRQQNFYGRRTSENHSSCKVALQARCYGTHVVVMLYYTITYNYTIFVSTSSLVFFNLNITLFCNLLPMYPRCKYSTLCPHYNDYTTLHLRLLFAGICTIIQVNSILIIKVFL